MEKKNHNTKDKHSIGVYEIYSSFTVNQIFLMKKKTSITKQTYTLDQCKLVWKSYYNLFAP